MTEKAKVTVQSYVPLPVREYIDEKRKGRNESISECICRLLTNLMLADRTLNKEEDGEINADN